MIEHSAQGAGAVSGPLRVVVLVAVKLLRVI